MRRAGLVTALSIISILSFHASAGDLPRLAVMDLKADIEMKQGTVSTLNQILLTSFHDTGRFEVIGSSDIKAMLTLEEDRIKLTGCSDDSCLAEIGGALGAKYVALARLGKIGDEFILSLSLLDVKQARVVERTSEEVSDDEAKLVDAVKRAVAKVTSTAAKVRDKKPAAQGPVRLGASVEETGTVWTWAPWTVLGLTVVAGAAGGVLGGLAYSDANEASSKFAGDPSVKDLQDSSESKALAADVMFGVAGAAAVTTVLLFLLAPREPEAKASALVAPAPGGIVAGVSIDLD